MVLVGLTGYRGYPGGFKAYRKAFPTVELSWWHRAGDPKTIARLRALAPEGFRFSVFGHKHLAFRPSGEERRILRRFLRRFRAFGEKRGAVRLLVPEVDLEAFGAWLDLLEEVQKEIGPTPIAFQAPPALREAIRARGYALVNEGGGPFLYLLDPEKVPQEGTGFAYFTNPPPGPTLIAEVDPD